MGKAIGLACVLAGICFPLRFCQPQQFAYILLTLDYLINVQDVIIMQAGNLPKINKCAGCNKAMQVGIFQKSIVKKSSLLENFQKLINVQDVIRPCRLENFKKLIRTCCTFIR